MGLQLLAQIGETFKVEIPLRSFFEAPTVACLAQEIERARTGSADAASAAPSASPVAGKSLPETVIPIQSRGDKRPFFCVAPGGGVVFPYYNMLPHLDQDRPFYGLQDPGLDKGGDPYLSVEDLAAYYVEVVRAVQTEGRSVRLVI